MLDRTAKGPGDGLPVLGVDHLEELLQPVHGRLGRQPQQALKVLVEALPVGGDVPVPGAHACCPQGRPQAQLALTQRRLGPPALGHVPEDLGEADQPAPGVVQRADDAQRPELLPALAQVPVLVLGAALLPRRAQFPLRHALLPVFGREDQFDGLPDDKWFVVYARH